MTSELETGISDAASDAPVENPRPSDLLEVTFQKNPNQRYKYLEAEPKLLGVTEIALTVFFFSAKAATFTEERVLNFIMASSFIGLIAGSLAIAAQKLHLPTLKACLGIQIVMCVIYGFLLLILSTSPQHDLNMSPNSTCWEHYYSLSEPEDVPDKATGLCVSVMNGVTHVELISELIVAVQIALSATLAAYCCKVIQCCSPRSHVPVIAMKSHTAPE